MMINNDLIFKVLGNVASTLVKETYGVVSTIIDVQKENKLRKINKNKR